MKKRSRFGTRRESVSEPVFGFPVEQHSVRKAGSALGANELDDGAITRFESRN
jgi:hypothetical protein